VLRHLAEKLATDVFGLEELLLRNEVHCGDERPRQLAQLVQLRPGPGGFLIEPPAGQDVDLSFPAGFECWIVVAGSRVGSQGFVVTAHIAISVAFLLVRATFLRCNRLDLLQQLQRCLEILLVAPADSAHVQRVEVSGIRLEDLAQVHQSVVEVFRDDLALDGLQIRIRDICFHASSHH
jgi:hypothetical protein